MSAPPIEQEALPAIYEHCQNVYRQMESEAKLHASEYKDETFPNAKLVWEGHLTKLFNRLHLSVPYYTSVTRELKRMGCIKQLRRGGGNSPSQWLIMTEPTEELFLSDSEGNASGERLRKNDRMGMLEQQVRDMAKRQTKIEADYEAILDVLQERE